MVLGDLEGLEQTEGNKKARQNAQRGSKSKDERETKSFEFERGANVKTLEERNALTILSIQSREAGVTQRASNI